MIDTDLMQQQDRVFWERLAEMPWVEAEQECVSRREELCLQLASLHASANNFERKSRLRGELDTGIAAITGQLTLLNERIKYLRKAQDTVTWKRAVSAVYGDDGVVACLRWIEGQRETYPAPGARA